MGYGDLLFINNPKKAATPAPTTASWTPAGGGQYVGGTATNVVGGNSQVTTQPYVPYTPPKVETPAPAPTYTPPAYRGPTAAEIAAEQARLAEEARVNQALKQAKVFFETYGLSTLWNGVEKYIRSGYNDMGTIAGALSRDPEYQSAYFNRFPAVQQIREINKQRQAQGQPIMAEPSPATYVALEEGYRMALVGLPTGLWGTTQDVTEWIVKDVSPQEVASRVTVAKNYINYSANQSVKTELRSIYGMTDADMASYVLDSERTLGYVESEYQTRLRQANVGAAAGDAGLSISTDMRDSLAGNDTYGASYGNSLSGFQSVAQIADTYNALGRMSGIRTTTDELVTDQFGLQGAADISTKKRKLSSQERARFSGTSAITTTSLNAKPIGSV